MIKKEVNPWRRCNLQNVYDQRSDRYRFTPVQKYQNGHQIQLGIPKWRYRAFDLAVDDDNLKEMNNDFIS